MKKPSRIVAFLRGVVGGMLGGALGYYAFVWMYQHGFYALIVPGTLVGVGFGLCSGQRSLAGGIACGVVGVALGIFTEWRWFPFANDQSLTYFLTHLHELRPVTLILTLLAGVFSFWFGLGPGRAVGRAGSGSERGQECDRSEKSERGGESEPKGELDLGPSDQ